ncbi:hypothetical protein PsYK624_012600 [Phanerochaete sordida]|uniref:DUF7029 domain-containing protein n=1 Tax=Phanerochaete sordida TaxID=48140 RepID=A0A9P3L8Z3_9APHY|nr:hypothetical protein PsYK624_012600 [Phanerochaete sordida]
MRISHSIVFAALATVTLAVSPRLVPAKRGATSLGKRSLWRRDIIPKEEVILSYAISPYHPPSAAVTLAAHDERPIILVEDLDYLLHSVSCYGSRSNALGHTITLEFLDEDAFQLAAAEWLALQTFAVVTAHAGCNAADEHGAWRVTAALADIPRLNLILMVEPVELRDIIRSFGVAYSHTGIQTWAPNNTPHLSRRDEHGFDNTTTFGYNSTLPPRLALFPPNSTLNSSVSEDTLQNLTSAGLAITCVDCTFTTDITLGFDLQVDVGDLACITSSEKCFTLNVASMNVTIDQFEQYAALEVFIADEVNAGADYKILEFAVSDTLVIPSLVEIGPVLGLEIAFELDLAGSINFTVGAGAHIPSGAYASVSLLNVTDGGWDPTFTATGWDGSGVDQVPFRLNAGELNITTSAALAPYVGLAFTVLDAGAELRLVQNMPKFEADAGVLADVNRDCMPIGADDYESFGTAFSFGGGLKLSTEAELILEEGKIFGDGIPDDWDISLWDRDLPFSPLLSINDTSCFVLVEDTPNTADFARVALAGVPAVTGTLLTALYAVPTWDFNKIESYYSANGALPTNVNYTQMVQATTVPTNLQAAVIKAVAPSAAPNASSSGGSSSGGSGSSSSAAVGKDTASVAALCMSLFIGIISVL